MQDYFKISMDKVENIYLLVNTKMNEKKKKYGRTILENLCDMKGSLELHREGKQN